MVPTFTDGVINVSGKLGQDRTSVVAKNSITDPSISVQKVNSTISLSRSGFMSSSGCIAFLLAGTVREHLVRLNTWPKRQAVWFGGKLLS
jgi:hypothetical protein